MRLWSDPGETAEVKMTGGEQRLHDVRFPGQPDAYRDARNELLRAELELRRSAEAASAQRRELPPGGEVASDYAFEEWDAGAGALRTVRLSELFDDKDTLFLYSFRRARRQSVPDCDRLHPPQRGDPPLLEQRAVDRASRAWPERSTRRFHVAHLGDARPHEPSWIPRNQGQIKVSVKPRMAQHSRAPRGGLGP
jgi:Bacterial protein of unknown function (DUF899)